MKKLIAFALSAVLAIGSTGVVAFGSVFADINTVPWSGAATYIDRAQSLSLMSGYLENGKRYCKPRNNVTYCENAQMIYSIMKANKGADVTAAQVEKWTQVLATYSVPTWAYSALAFCLENGYVTAAELSKYKDGTQAANREDVGVVFGRALATQKTINTSATLSYKDASAITASYVPYLALLNSSKIMVGDTDNKFNPKSNINRAEMSVLSVRMYDAMAGSSAPTAGTATGTVVNSIVLSNGDVFLSVKLADGSGVNLFGKSTVKVLYESNEVTLSDIGEGDTVSVTYSGETLSAVTITKSVAGINTNKTVNITALTSSKITVKEGTSATETSYRLATGATVTIATKNSSVSALITALEDENYMAVLTFDKATGYVTNIAAVKSSDNPLSGEVTYMNSSRIGITVGNKEYQYPFAENVSIKFGSKTIAFTTLQSDYKDTLYSVSLTLNASGYVSAVKVDFMEDETNGSISFLNSNRVTLSANGTTYTYYLNDDVEVTIDGKSSTVAKLIAAYESTGFRVSLTLDRYDGVDLIEATTKNTGSSSGTLTSITASVIKIKSGSATYTYDLSSPTIKVDGTTVSLANFRNVYADYTYTVALTFNSNGAVTGITAKNTTTTSGVLKNIEPAKETIEITVGHVNYTYDLASSVTITLDGSTSTTTKLDTAFENALYDEQEITIKLTLNSSDQVTKIVATTQDATTNSLSGTIRSIDTTQLRIKTTSGSTYYDFASSVTITLDGVSKTVRQLVSAYDTADANGEDIYIKLTLNSSNEITKVVATTDESASNTKSGTLSAMSVAQERLTIGSTVYYTAENTGATISYVLTGTYANTSYANSLTGLKTFFDETSSAGDTCYLTLTLDKNGEITKIVAKNK